MKKSKYFSAFVLLTIAVLYSSEAFAKKPRWQLEVGGSVLSYDISQMRNVPMAKCEVILYKDNVLVKDIQDPAHGEFSFMLDPDADYIISCGSEGYITEQIEVNTNDVPYDVTRTNFTKKELTIVLFKTYPEYSYAFLDKPLVRICFNYATEDFDYDAAYETAHEKNFDKMNSLSAIAIKRQDYPIKIAVADSAFANEKWDDAKAAYTAASADIPTEQYPKDQIKICDEKIAAKEAERQAKDKKYADLIAQADAKFTAGDYVNAKNLYQSAYAVYPELLYPKSRMTDCDNAIAHPVDEKGYKKAIADGDTKFKMKDYDGAIIAYQKALNIKPAEQYPKDQMAKCDDALKNAATVSDVSTADEKYDNLIKIADQKFAAKDYAGAKAKYQEASALKPQLLYPKDQIAKCDNSTKKMTPDEKYQAIIFEADQLFNKGDFSGAREKYQEAAAMKKTEEYPKDRIALCDQKLADEVAELKYRAIIAKGDSLYRMNDFEGAKTVYQEASSIKPDDQYPLGKIKICDNAIANEKEKKYNDDIADGDAKMKLKDWTSAKAKYQEALKLKPGEQYPKDQIAVCDQAIANGW